ncbi:hypothetical protein [Limnohabitans sp.]|uniref:hypothetical protein n=1 Tax=Limnohabitans sp. TaxID=1907725 RepID=UPI0031204B54
MSKASKGHVADLKELIERFKHERHPYSKKRADLARKLLAYLGVKRIDPEAHRTMKNAWEQIEKKGIAPLVLLNIVHCALDDANNEETRPATKPEGLLLDDVRAKLVALRGSIKRAIDGHALPSGKAWLLEFETVPDEAVVFGFDGMAGRDYGFMAFELAEAIEAGLLVLGLHRDALPVRLEKRKHGKSPAFVRSLDVRLRRLHGLNSPATVAAIANAVGAPGSPWDRAGVIGVTRCGSGKK